VLFTPLAVMLDTELTVAANAAGSGGGLGGGAGGGVAAEARVDLVLVDLSAGPGHRKLLRHLPAELAAAVDNLVRGPQ